MRKMQCWLPSRSEFLQLVIKLLMLLDASVQLSSCIFPVVQEAFPLPLPSPSPRLSSVIHKQVHHLATALGCIYLYVSSFHPPDWKLSQVRGQTLSGAFVRGLGYRKDAQEMHLE